MEKVSRQILQFKKNIGSIGDHILFITYLNIIFHLSIIMWIILNNECFRKRDEKLQAAALAREAQEKLRQAQLEKAEKERQEKARQFQLEREEKLQEAKKVLKNVM